MVVLNSYPEGEVRVMREAEALVRHGYEVDVICLRLRGQPAVETCNGVRVYRAPMNRSMRRVTAVQFLEYAAFFALAFLQLTALHLRRPYTSVQVHNLPDFLVFAAVVPKLTGAPVLLDLHDLMPEFYAARYQAGQDSRMVRLVRLQERLACRFADHVITVTEHWRQSLIRRHLPPDKCLVLMNLADDRIFNVRKPPAEPAPSVDQAPFRLIYHGALFERYGLDLAVTAVDRLRAEIPSLHLTIIGRGPFRDALAEQVAGLGLERHVSLEPFARVETLPERLIQADLAVVPYRADVFTRELLPTKLLEYAALGIPAVVARTPVVEAYFDEGMVRFFPPGDVAALTTSLRELHHNRAQLARLAVGIQAFHERYNWPQQSQAYVDLVDALSGRRG
jgi:glycosyltransferase involved in cell wall biosynthesis